MLPALCPTHAATRHHGQGANQKGSDLSGPLYGSWVAPSLSELLSLPGLPTDGHALLTRKKRKKRKERGKEGETGGRKKVAQWLETPVSIDVHQGSTSFVL